MFRFALLCLTATGFALAQDRPDPDLYQVFFGQVAALKDIAPAARLANGDVVPMKVHSLQEATGLAEDEVEQVKSIAADFASKLAGFYQASRAVTFEARLQVADTGAISDSLALEVKKLEDRRVKLVLEHVQELKTVLPAAAFDKVAAYVRAPASEKKPIGSYLEPHPAVAGPDKQ